VYYPFTNSSFYLFYGDLIIINTSLNITQVCFRVDKQSVIQDNKAHTKEKKDLLIVVKPQVSIYIGNNRMLYS
jgi:hypothetical protein